MVPVDCSQSSGSLVVFFGIRETDREQRGSWEAGPPDGSGKVSTEIKIYTSNSFLYSTFYNFMYTFKGFNKIYQPFPDM